MHRYQGIAATSGDSIDRQKYRPNWLFFARSNDRTSRRASRRRDRPHRVWGASRGGRITAITIPDFCPDAQSVVNEGRNIVAAIFRNGRSGDQSPNLLRHEATYNVLRSIKVKDTEHGSGTSKAYESSPLPRRQGHA